ncbi:hypothetical protein [Candidatus Clostridium radicumherbarum]|uniref:Uncharacterized protein n=1 Tax=Candidatus Clostridium radicumherbarum TaxID=3381662 RepID=A0ABW8TUD1_9CLOT
MKKKGFFISLITSLMMIFSFSIPTYADVQNVQNGQNGTTLINANVTAAPSWERVFDWSINKSVTPNVWNLFQGDTGTSKYNIAVTKGTGIDYKKITGIVTVTNGGAESTENLSITVRLTNPSGSVLYLSVPVDISGNPVLDPGETGNYSYTIDYPAANLSLTYKVTADITITNHSGSLGTPKGPSPSSDGFSFPSSPVLVNDVIHVDDTNGSSYLFNTSGSVSYDKTFSALDKGTNVNTATIKETGADSTASVTVNTYALDVSKTANTAFTRTYTWTINKTGDQSEITLALNEIFPVNYKVTVDGKYTDINWKAAGTISVHNPAPMAAVINSISDIVAPDIAASTNFGVTFPYILDAGATLNGTYSANLPDTADRINTASAVLQNYAYDSNGNTAPNGTTAFSGTANVSFANASINLVDESVNVTDSLAGTLGTLSYTDVLPKTYTYLWTVGPYASSGDYTVNNTATFTTNDTGITGSSSWSVIIHLPSHGATLTIGYWKTHAGFGPQKDVVTQYLPIWLGTPNGAKSVNVTSASLAVKYLSMNGDASNGINKLYAQLLAAKLNIANGADGTVINKTIAAADAFLSTNNSSSWSSLSKTNKNLVLGWASTLDNYNNGLMGVPHAVE